MKKVACCYPFELILFTMLLLQDTLCQVLHKRTSPDFSGENSVALLVCYKMVGLALGLE